MKYLSIVMCLTFFSCASYQNGKKAVQAGSEAKKEDIVVTAYQSREYSTPHFSYIQVEFGNNTQDWFDINKVLINYKGKDLKIVLGPRLVDWGNAIKNKVAVDRHNREMIWGAVAGAAAVGAYSSASRGSYSSAKTYAVVMAGAAVASSVNELTQKISDIERTKVFPESHLYAPFSAPPGLVNKRWILIQHAPGVSVDNLSFDIYLKSGKKRTYNVKI